MKNRFSILITIGLAVSLAACSSQPNLTENPDSSITDLISGDANLGEQVDAVDNTPAAIDLGLNASIPGWTGVKFAFNDPKEIEIAKGITTDSSGNVIALADLYGGFVKGTVASSDGGTYQADIGYTHPRNAGVAKLDPSGNRVWLRTLGSSDQSSVPFGPFSANINIRATGVTGAVTDPSGNVYVAGFTRTALNGQVNAGGDDAFLVKYSSSGNLIWTRVFGANADDGVTGVAVNGTNIYLTGYACGGGKNFYGSMVRGACDVFVTKYESNGNRSWAKLYGSNGNDLAAKIAKVSSGGAVLVGSYQGAVDVNGFALNSDGFVIRIDPNGNTIWNRTIATPKSEEALAVAVSSDAVYVGGNTLGNLNGVPRIRSGNYKGDPFVVKISLSAGLTQWTRFIAPLNVYGADTSWGRVTDLALDSGGQLFAFGDGYNSFQDNVDLAWPVRFDANGNRTASAETPDYLKQAMTVGTDAVFTVSNTLGGPVSWRPEYSVAVSKSGFDLKLK
jgi:hypothetical protein